MPTISETGFRVFSRFETDGMLLFIFSVPGMTNKTFVEIGSDDGVNRNSANLYFKFGWRGLFIDGNLASIKRGKRFFKNYPHPWFYQPKFLHAMVNRENVNDLIRGQGFEGEVGFLSTDIDGNDYWVWDALEVIDPQVVIIELISLSVIAVIIPGRRVDQKKGLFSISLLAINILLILLSGWGLL